MKGEDNPVWFTYGPRETDISKVYAYLKTYKVGYRESIWFTDLVFEGYEIPKYGHSELKSLLKERFRRGLIPFKQTEKCRSCSKSYTSSDLSDLYLADGSFYCVKCDEIIKRASHSHLGYYHKYIAKFYKEKIRKNIPVRLMTKYGPLMLNSFEYETKTYFCIPMVICYGYNDGVRYEITDTWGCRLLRSVKHD